VEGDETERHQIESGLDRECQWISVGPRKGVGAAGNKWQDCPCAIKEHGDGEYFLDLFKHID
jgi:hypothetical protein